MEDKNRRNFLKTAALISGTTLGLAATNLKAETENVSSQDKMGVLVDTTVCIGCRNCEFACKSAHDIPTKDVETYHNREVFKEFRRPTSKALTVVNEFKNPKNELVPINVKYQCMHCDKPACVSACIVGAFQKHANGSVTWDGDKCIGCRYCMVACPFQVPTFDFEKALRPDIHKCDFCFNRTKDGKLPACVEICPVEAITYGPRTELIRTAKKRIQRYPERYKNYIYGENEVGGTSWMYLSSMDFQYLKLPKHKTYPAPGVSESIQHGIFAYFIPPLALYAWLGGIMWVSKRRVQLEKEIGEIE
jgi:Fe-S-cluster-containing dehydrogenase component